MNRSLGSWMLGYGAFLVAAGAIGYLNNPERAATALASGGTFGALSIGWGLLLRAGRRWAWTGALVTTALLAAVFAWRGTLAWQKASADPDKLVAAVIISAMGLASLATLYVLVTRRCRDAGAPP